MGIKDEICGPNGYLKKVRDHYLPNSKIMADLAFERYQQHLGQELTTEYILSHADEVLKGLFMAETELFNEKNGQVLSSAIPFYYNQIYREHDEHYPETNENIERLNNLFEACRDRTCDMPFFISEISQTMGPIMAEISFSQKQAAKCRVGNTLQNHLAKIFEMCGIPNESQQQRDGGGTIMDFIIPNLSACETMPDQVINIECQTTLKDRFRLTTGKSTDGRMKRYLATATGCGIITQRDINDLTVEKVREIIVDNNVTLVVFEEVKQNMINKITNLYVRMVETNDSHARECEQLLRMCNNKMISYKELVNRDIRSIMVYWEQ